MNLVISVVFISHLFKVIQKKYTLRFKSRFLILLGTILPSVDYVIRYYREEPILSSVTVLFQSLPYQGLFWGILALFYWIYKRSFHKAGVLLLPIAGMALFIFLASFTPEKIYFLKPFSEFYISLNLIRSGYLLPLLLIFLLWTVKRWSRFLRRRFNSLSISIVILSLLVAVCFKTYTYFTLPDGFTKSSNLILAPSDHFMVNWNAVELNGKGYYFSTYRILSGWNTDIKIYPVSNDYDLLQSILIYPELLTYYNSAFQVPVVKTSVKNENLLVEYTELTDLNDILWMDYLVVERNRRGQVLQSKKNYKFFNWNLEITRKY